MKQKVQVWIFLPTHFVVNSEELKVSKSIRSSVSVLLLQRKPELRSEWQPVTGGVEEGEALIEAALRELKEETGISLTENKLMDLNYSFDFEGRWGKARESVFYSILDSKPKILIDPSEHQDYCWVDFEELENRIHYPSQKEAFRRIKLQRRFL